MFHSFVFHFEWWAFHKIFKHYYYLRYISNHHLFGWIREIRILKNRFIHQINDDFDIDSNSNSVLSYECSLIQKWNTNEWNIFALFSATFVPLFLTLKHIKFPSDLFREVYDLSMDKCQQFEKFINCSILVDYI